MAEPQLNEEFEKAMSEYLALSNLKEIAQKATYLSATIRVSKRQGKITVSQSWLSFDTSGDQPAPPPALDASPCPDPSKTPAES